MPSSASSSQSGSAESSPGASSTLEVLGDRDQSRLEDCFHLLLALLVAADTVAEDWAASRQTEGGSIRADSAWVRRTRAATS